jgi:hypothetical protein
MSKSSDWSEFTFRDWFDYVLARCSYPGERAVVYPAHNATNIYEGVGALPLKPEARARPVQRHLEDIKQIIREFIKEP